MNAGGKLEMATPKKFFVIETPQLDAGFFIVVGIWNPL